MTIVYCYDPNEGLKTRKKELSYICNSVRDINKEKNIPCIEYYDIVSFIFMGYDYPSTPYFKDIEHQSWEV